MTYPFSYIPLIQCPFCNDLIDCVDLDDKSIIKEYDEKGIGCPKCGELILYENFTLIKKWNCAKCNTDFSENTLIDLHSKKQFECPECTATGQISRPFKEFKLRVLKDGSARFTCPFRQCNKSYPESELIPDGNGVIAKCPVCQRFAQMPIREK